MTNRHPPRDLDDEKPVRLKPGKVLRTEPIVKPIEPILTESGMAEAIEVERKQFEQRLADVNASLKKYQHVTYIQEAGWCGILDAINRRFLLARTKLESAKQWTNPPRTQQLIQVQLAARRLAREFEALEGS